MGDRTDIEDFEKKMFEFLVKTYELTGGKASKATHMDKVGKELGFEPALTTAITNHLLEEGLIDLPALGGSISITDKGIARVEGAQS
jgi:hypothetical protein